MKDLLIFVFIFLGLLFSYFYTHIYVAKFISQISFVKNKILIKNLFIFLFIFSFLSLILRVRISNAFLEYVYISALSWMGIVIILGTFCLIGNLVNIIFKNLNKDVVVFSVVFISFCSVIHSFYNGNKIPKIKEINIKSLNPNSKNKISIVFIADTHFDFRYKNKIGLKIFKKIEKIEPDFLIIGGDFLDPGFTFDEEISKIKEFDFKKIIVFGNHEYYFGLDKSRQIFENLGFLILKNNSLIIDKINFIGLGDIRTENLSKQEVLEIIGKNYKVGYLNIVISHQPLYFKEISENFDVIMLSGHTHKGQIFPFHIFTKFTYNHFYGLYKNKNSYLYVTSGVGVWGPPMRFLAESEIVKINLIKL